MKKLIVVTGGTKGIGKAIIQKFAEKDFAIATCSRTQDDLEVLQNEVILAQPDAQIFVQKADLSVKQEAQYFGEFVKGIGLPIEVLVNNSGVFVPGEIHKEDDGVLEHTINTNLYSAYHLTRSLISEMINKKSGHIFNMCSTASIIPYTNGGSYCISKFALLGMTKVLREEMKPFGIRVTAVMPGATYTDSWADTDLPEARFMDPDDVAESVWSAYTVSKRAVVEEILIRPQLGDI